MHTSTQAEATRLADSVRALIQDNEAELSVLVETGPDEAMMVGTTDAFLRLAEIALRVASGMGTGDFPRTPPDNWDGVLVQQHPMPFLFDVLAEIQPDCAIVVASEEERVRVREYMWGLSPPYNMDPPSAE